jgi:hypothetical protein
MAADGTRNKKNTGWKKEYELFSKCYRGRTDWVGKRKNGTYEQISGGLTYERFKEHMELVNTYALYQMDNSGKVFFCLFDTDFESFDPQNYNQTPDFTPLKNIKPVPADLISGLG